MLGPRDAVRRSRLAIFAGLLGVAATVAGACGGDESGSSAAPDSGTTSVIIGSSICPSPDAAAPRHGDPCLLPQGATCAFGACASSIAQCIDGIWLIAGNPPPTPVCPGPEPPAEGTACPPCWPSNAACPYGSADCTAPDASANRAIATCTDGRWKLDYIPCGGTKGDADVQGDARLDAD